MRVIGAGFGRTGTASLKAALDELGVGPCYHMSEVVAHPRHARFWRSAADGERVDWTGFFAPYGSTVDWPGCAFYRELMEAFPSARVLLSVRDPESWYRSCRETIHALQASLPVRVVSRAVPLFPFSAPARTAGKIVWEQTFDGRFADKAHAIAVFERHIEDVKRTVPADQLLVFDVKEGWEPLCRWLELPVPDRPFPRLNDTAEFQKRVRLAKLTSNATLGVAAAATAAVLRWLVRRAAS